MNVVLLDEGEGLIACERLASEAVVETLLEVLEAADERALFLRAKKLLVFLN